MKTILVPTDFSAASRNAAIHAIKIAEKVNASLHFLHAFHLPVVTVEAEAYLLSETLDEIKSNADRELNQFLDSLMELNDSGLRYSSEVKMGLVLDEIEYSIKSAQASLIVMGTTGSSGLTKTLIGSTTSSLISRVDIPVLAIPEACLFNNYSKILLTSDFASIKNIDVLNPLHEFAKEFNSELIILSVLNAEDELPQSEKALELLSITNYFSDFRLTVDTYYHHDAAKGIEEFASNVYPDLIVTIPHKKSWLEKLFSKSVTYEVANLAKFPLMTLPV